MAQEDPTTFMLHWLNDHGFLEAKDAYIVEDALGSMQAVARKMNALYERLEHYSDRMDTRVRAALDKAGKDGREKLIREMLRKYGPEIAEPIIAMAAMVKAVNQAAKSMMESVQKLPVPPAVDVNLN